MIKGNAVTGFRRRETEDSGRFLNSPSLLVHLQFVARPLLAELVEQRLEFFVGKRTLDVVEKFLKSVRPLVRLFVLVRLQQHVELVQLLHELGFRSLSFLVLLKRKPE